MPWSAGPANWKRSWRSWERRAAREPGRASHESGDVLIVDDDPALLEALPEALRLRMTGLTVETAESAAAALDPDRRPRLRRNRHRHQDAGIDGLELLAEIRARRPERRR